MVIQIFNSKLGITIRVLVTSATILMAKRTNKYGQKNNYPKIHKHGLNHGIMTYH